MHSVRSHVVCVYGRLNKNSVTLTLRTSYTHFLALDTLTLPHIHLSTHTLYIHIHTHNNAYTHTHIHTHTHSTHTHSHAYTHTQKAYILIHLHTHTRIKHILHIDRTLHTFSHAHTPTSHAPHARLKTFIGLFGSALPFVTRYFTTSRRSSEAAIWRGVTPS